MSMYLVCLMDDGKRGGDIAIAVYETLQEAAERYSAEDEDYAHIVEIPSDISRQITNIHCTR